MKKVRNRMLMIAGGRSTGAPVKSSSGPAQKKEHNLLLDGPVSK